MATEANLDAKFSHKAAEILEELNKKEIQDMREKYKRNLEKLRKNMIRLKEAQDRIRGFKIAEPITHQEAVTSGDYYMFQDADKDVDLIAETEEESKFTEESDGPQTPSVSKFMETVFKEDIEQALKLADTSETSSEKFKNKCDCMTKEATDSSMQLNEEEFEEDENTNKGKTRMNRQKSDNVPKASSTVLKNKKQQPSVKFQRRKSTKSFRDEETPERTESETKKCDCGHEDCRCGEKFYNTLRHYLCLIIKFVKAFISSCMSSLIQIFNKLSYDFKQIRKQLEKEKDIEKHRLSPPFPIFSPSMPRSKKTPTKRIASYQVPLYLRLLLSFHDVVISHFSTFCFFSVLFLQMKNSSLLCLPLTMLVLFWGSLSVPRPTKRFWKILFAYTVFILLVECIFRSPLVQYSSEPFNSSPYELNLFSEIYKYDNYSIYCLIVILAIFLQRRLLINIGLWPNEPPLEIGGNIMRTGFESVKNFFRKLLYDRHKRIPVDVYTHIFICDFINIIVFIFGFASLTEKKEYGVSRYFSENKIPPALLVIFVIQCLMMFVDRWIYLRRHVVAKLIFQFIQIIMIHFCLFLLLPAAIFRRFNELFFPTLWYCIKCIYFLLSAYQIRCGYPASVHGQALCQGFNVVNLYLYQFYLIFPFVYELRTITDWMWTETTLTLSEWLGMEDIFSTVFLIKCWRNYENKYSYKRGEKITSTVKFTAGGGLVLLFFLILFFPLVFFAFGRVAGETNLPQEMQIKFRIGSYEPIFTALTINIQSLSVNQWMRFKNIYKYSPAATTFLSEYSAEDVGVMQFSNYSISEWSYLPTFNESIISNLEMGKPIKIVSEWTLLRKTGDTRQSNLVTGIHSSFLSNEIKSELLQVLHGTKNSFSVDNICPKFLKISSATTAYPIEALMTEYLDTHLTPSYGNITFYYKAISDNGTMWWQASEHFPNTSNLIQTVNAVVSKNYSGILILTFNDKIFSYGIFYYFSDQGIIGLYTTFLISLGLFIRRFVRGRTNQIFLDYIPNVDSTFQLLLDIYFVREHKDGKLEEDLYAKLIFLFRSPETLIRWTRLPEDSG